jgi:UDPglucose 6-dehydrogenase
MKVTMIGLGKLGLPVAESMAQHYKVDGFDIGDTVTDKVYKRPSLEVAIEDADIIFIAVPTPHDKEYGGETPSSHLPVKDFDYQYLDSVLDKIKKSTHRDQIIVNISTTLPGTIRPLIEKYQLADQFIYNPYLIAMGTVSDDFLNPDLLMIGTDSGQEDHKTKTLIEFYKKIIQREPYTMIGTFEDAECCKIFHNTYISAKVGIANMIQDVTHKLGNADPDNICRALQHADRVVGKRYMMPGMGDGGPCHPRDNIALSWLANKLDLGYDLFKDIMTSREVQTQNLQKFVSEFSGNLPICIVGSSFKPETHLTDGSSSLLLGHYLSENNHPVFYDTVTSDSAYCYVLCHDKDYSDYQFNPDSIVIDVFRKFTTERNDLEVFYYGKN